MAGSGTAEPHRDRLWQWLTASPCSHAGVAASLGGVCCLPALTGPGTVLSFPHLSGSPCRERAKVDSRALARVKDRLSKSTQCRGDTCMEPGGLCCCPSLVEGTGHLQGAQMDSSLLPSKKWVHFIGRGGGLLLRISGTPLARPLQPCLVRSVELGRGLWERTGVGARDSPSPGRPISPTCVAGRQWVGGLDSPGLSQWAFVVLAAPSKAQRQIGDQVNVPERAMALHDC